MDNKQAKQILSERLKGDTFTTEKLDSNWYLCVSAKEKEGTLDGRFTSDELEAIAAWMRDPTAVTTA